MIFGRKRPPITKEQATEKVQAYPEEYHACSAIGDRRGASIAYRLALGAMKEIKEE
jgi:hypothetical protein